MELGDTSDNFFTEAESADIRCAVFRSELVDSILSQRLMETTTERRTKDIPTAQFEQHPTRMSRGLPDAIGIVERIVGAHDVDDVGSVMFENLLFAGKEVVVLSSERRDIVIELLSSLIVQDSCRERLLSFGRG